MNRRTRERLNDLAAALENIVGDNYEVVDDPNMEAIPTPVEVSHPLLAAYEINIRQVNNGFIVNVGCQTFVFEKFETAVKYIDLYFQDPSGMEKKHYEGTLFK